MPVDEIQLLSDRVVAIRFERDIPVVTKSADGPECCLTPLDSMTYERLAIESRPFWKRTMILPCGRAISVVGLSFTHVARVYLWFLSFRSRFGIVVEFHPPKVIGTQLLVRCLKKKKNLWMSRNNTKIVCLCLISFSTSPEGVIPRRINDTFCYIAMVYETVTRKRSTFQMVTSPSSTPNMSVASEVPRHCLFCNTAAHTKFRSGKSGVEITGARRVSMQQCCYREKVTSHTLPSVDARSTIAAFQVCTCRLFWCV